MVKNKRCAWCEKDALYVRYHDMEWGVPLRDRNGLFELLVMEGMQAGLSWITILRKRKRFRQLLHKLNPEKLAATDSAFIDALMQEEGIIRHRGKLQASVLNARAFLALEKTHNLVEYLWSFTGPEPVCNQWASKTDVPAFTEESTLMAKSLKKAGFRFVGPTICYAFMQSAGMVNDHLLDCFRHQQCMLSDTPRSLVE